MSQKQAGAVPFGRSVRGLVAALWRGTIDPFTFMDSMISAIERRYRQAWLEGAKECGIEEADLSSREQVKLAEMTNRDIGYLPGLARAIVTHTRADGFRLGPLLTRAELWTNRYEAVRLQGAALACGDKKKKWGLGKTKEHCTTCLAFHGRVYRYSVWEENEALPRSRRLECKGYR